MSRLTSSMIRGAMPDIRDRAGIVQPRYASPLRGPLFYKIVPWSGGTYIYPLSADTNPHGYTQFFFSVDRPSEQGKGYYEITNVLDGYLYCKIGGQSPTDTLNTPDLVLSPYQHGTLYPSDNDVAFVSSVAGHDFITTRSSYAAGAQTQFNPRGTGAGVYIVDGDKPISAAIPHGYQRIYDIYDLTVLYPNTQTNRPPGGSSSLAISTTGGQNALILNAVDPTGATAIEGRINIRGPITGSGTACTLHLGNINTGPFGTETVSITSQDFNLTFGEVRVPPTSNGLDMDLTMWLDIGAAAAFNIDVAYVILQLGGTT